MAVDDTTWAWEPIDGVQVYAGGQIWIAELALAWHADAYYLRVQTYQVGAPDHTRVRVVGPYSDVMRALAAVRRLVHGALAALAGALESDGTGAPAASVTGR